MGENVRVLRSHPHLVTVETHDEGASDQMAPDDRLIGWSLELRMNLVGHGANSVYGVEATHCLSFYVLLPVAVVQTRRGKGPRSASRNRSG